MLTVAVANTKGGTGKTTLACHLAAAFSHTSTTSLVDLDRQGCATSFVSRRPRDLPRIRLIDDVCDAVTHRTVVDLPAGKRGLIEEIIPHVDAIVVPVMPSAFDEIGVALFLDRLRDLKEIRRGKRAVYVVANRCRVGTRSADRLAEFLRALSVPLVATVHDRQDYALAAATGVTAFDGPLGRGKLVRADLAPLFGALSDVADDGLASYRAA